MKQLLWPCILSALSLGQLTATAQVKNYSATESVAIHDSIQKTRWDIGGSLSQYSFRYMSEFFPVGIVQKPYQARPFLRKPNKAFEAISIKTAAGTLSLHDYLKTLHIAAFVVVHKGTIVYEKYLSILPQDQHSLQSVTKVITATLITNLINEKKIDINQSIDHYLPALKRSDWQGITVKDILNMRTGMDIHSIEFETGPFTNPKHKNYQLESALGILPKAPNTPVSVYQYLADMKKDTLPGLEARYSNINTFVLGWLAESVTGKKYADLVSERIWKPMGASSDAYVCLSADGIAWPHGGISTTLNDLARFGMLYTHSEIKARKESLISFAQLKEIFDAKPLGKPMPPFKWAYQWDMADNGIMMKSGFGGQALYVHPEQEIVIAYFNYVDKDWSIDNMISMEALKELIKAAIAAK